MKKVLIIIVLALCATVGSAQSGFRTVNSNGLPTTVGDEVSLKQVSFHNAWIGSSFSYQLAGEEPLNDNFLFNINLLYDIDFNGFHIPVSGNLSLPVQDASTLTDIEVGIYPWRIIVESKSGGVLVAHGGVSYGVLTSQSVDENTPQKIRALLGVEYSQPIGGSKLPLTLSVTPVYESESFVTSLENQFYLEATLIFPIANSLGLLAELVQPFESGVKTSFGIGVLVNGAIGR